MSKLFTCRALAVLALAVPAVTMADVTGTVTLNANSLNLDTGATVSSGGDISWDGTNLKPQGSATAADLAMFGFTGATGFSQLSSTVLSGLASAPGFLSASSIKPAVNDIVVVKTNGGHFAKVLVTAISGSITLQFDTFGTSGGGGGGGGAPTITSIVNNYSYIPAGFPNSGIAPGTIFLLFGSGMSDAPAGNVTLNSSAGSGIPTTSAGASLSVTAGGKTFTPGIYYATPGQIAAVLPSSTPTGNATITVTYKGQASNSFSFQVVPYALGFDTYYGTGSGLVTATSPSSGALYNFTNSAKPGDTIVMWGSGLGADTPDSDTVFTTSPHAVGTPLTIYFGGIAGTILYSGSSGYPGLNQIDVTIPSNAPTGCFVGVVGVTGSGAAITTTNFGSLAISPSGGECNDSILGISGGTISSLAGQTTVRSGSVGVFQLVGPKSPTDSTIETNNLGIASFSKDTGTGYATSSSTGFSLGSCFVTEVISTGGGGGGTTVGLDAGNINLTGPAGTYPLTANPIVKGTYFATLPAGAITSSGGAFTYNGSGGADVGSFNTTINLPNPLLTWTNQGAAATVNRAQGVTINWTGGGLGTYVVINGESTNEATGASGSFTCITTQDKLTFTVPNYVTLTLPAGSGSLSVENAASYGTFTASGLDFGFKFGYTGSQIYNNYQ